MTREIMSHDYKSLFSLTTCIVVSFEYRKNDEIKFQIQVSKFV